MITRLIRLLARRTFRSTALAWAVFSTGAHAVESAIPLSADQLRGGDIATLSLTLGDHPVAGRVTLTGRVEMAERGPDPVLAPANAMVVAVYAHPGDAVTAGAPLVAVAGPGVLALRQSFHDAETVAKTANQRADRDQMLYTDGIIALARLEQSKSAATLANGQLMSQRQLLGAARFDTGGRLVLRAPRGGFVSGPAFGTGDGMTVGELIAYIGKPLAPLISLDAPVSVARGLSIGDQLSIRSGGCTETAVLHAVGRTVDPTTQTVALHGEVEGPSCLLPGEIVTATVTPRALATAAFALPPSAFVRRGNATYLFLKSAQGFVPVPVDAEAARSGFALGPELHAGSQVVVRGAALLKAEWLKRSAG
jgi:hypothetical protein